MKSKQTHFIVTTKKTLSWIFIYSRLRARSSDRTSIRTLLELNESYLRLHGFNDPWCDEKQMENLAALTQLNERLQQIDQIHSSDEKWLQIFRGLFAGMKKIISVPNVCDLQFMRAHNYRKHF